MSRHRFSCRDIIFCCCRLHWLILCRDFSSHVATSTFLISAPSSAASALLPVMNCITFPLILHDFVTSELDCVDFQAASLTQQSDFNSALFLTAFLSTYCCIFLLSFSFPANDNLVSFCMILYINYSNITENKTEKWTKKR